MPSLSVLVTAKELITKIKIDVAHKTSISILDQIKEVVSVFPDIARDHDRSLRQLIDQKARSLAMLYDEHLNKIDREINALIPTCRNQSDEWAKKHRSYNIEEYEGFLARFYGHDESELDDKLVNLLQYNKSWQHPILIWQMSNNLGTDFALGYNPIYIVDRFSYDTYYIDKLPHRQLRKIRFYDLDHLMHLPVNCMAMVISKNYFTHCSDHFLYRELAFLSKLLRPGGTLAFNFNDCERSGCAQMFENGLRTFQEGTQVKKHLRDLGLEVIDDHYIDSSKTVFIAARKPGELQSIKLSEALGFIIPK